MLTLDEAYSLVQAELEAIADDPTPVIRKDATRAYAWGWVVFYQSGDFLESGDSRDVMAGNAPYIVNKHSGEIEATATALPVEHYIRDYEERLNQ